MELLEIEDMDDGAAHKSNQHHILNWGMFMISLKLDTIGWIYTMKHRF
jgi:hypothetical protein